MKDFFQDAPIPTEDTVEEYMLMNDVEYDTADDELHLILNQMNTVIENLEEGQQILDELEDMDLDSEDDDLEDDDEEVDEEDDDEEVDEEDDEEVEEIDEDEEEEEVDNIY